MAHHGRIASRIERLLNESSFRQAFAGGRGRIAAAVLLVVAAAFGSTALVRVQAAGQQAPPATTPSQPVAPASTPQAPAEVAPPPTADTPAPAAAPSDSAAPAPPPALDDDESPVVIQAPAAPRSPSNAPDVVPQGSYYFPIPKVRIAAGNARMMALMQADRARVDSRRKTFFRFGYGNDGNTYAYVTGDGEKNIHFSGSWYDGSRDKIESARKEAHGDFLWFERDGKSYVVDDPTVLAGLKPMQDQMDVLGQQQEGLGKQQEDLGRKQEALGKQMQQLKVPTPDMKKELDKLKAVEEKLAAIQGKDASQEELGSLQGELAEVQGQLGSLQGNMGGQMGELGSKMGELGGQQGKLGEQQGRLGEQQGRIGREMDGKILTIIDESLKNGKARQVK
jgi:hypothetical protein